MSTKREICACGHDAAMHTAPLLGGPDDSPCWRRGCPCYSYPEGLNAVQKELRRRESEGSGE